MREIDQKNDGLRAKSFAYESGLRYSAQPCRVLLKKIRQGVVKGVNARIIRVLGQRDRSLLESGSSYGGCGHRNRKHLESPPTNCRRGLLRGRVSKTLFKNLEHKQ